MSCEVRLGLVDDGTICTLYLGLRRIPGPKAEPVRLAPHSSSPVYPLGTANRRACVRIIDLICARYFDDRVAADPARVFDPVVPGEENPQCRQSDDVLQLVSAFTLALNLVVGALSALTAPLIGALSDRYGRKRLIVISSSGAIIGEVITILAAKYPNSIHYNWLLLGSFFDGLTGSFTAGSILSHAYTADCTPPSKRSVAIGYLHSCLFSGLAFGPLLAGYFVKWTGSLVSIFYVTLGCHIFFIFFMSCIAPESLSKRRQQMAREKYKAERAARAPVPGWNLHGASGGVPSAKGLAEAMQSVMAVNPFGPLKVLFPPGPQHSRLRRNLVTLAFIDMWLLGAAMSAGGVTVIYTEKMFGWRNFETSRFVSMVSMVRVLVLMGIYPVVNYVFRTRRNARRQRREGGAPMAEKNAGADELDIWVLRSALLSDVMGATGYIFSRTSGPFILSAIVTAFGGMGSATIQAALSKHVPAEQVGELLGGIGQLHSLARVVSPIVFNGLFYATVKTFPQAFFVLLTAIFALALGASFLVRPHGMFAPFLTSAGAQADVNC